MSIGKAQHTMENELQIRLTRIMNTRDLEKTLEVIFGFFFQFFFSKVKITTKCSA